MFCFFITKKQIIFYFSLFLTLCVAVKIFIVDLDKDNIQTFGKEDTKTYIAIIIDDFGNNSEGTAEMLSLPIKFTGAVMPMMPHSEEESEKLFSSGKDVILHMPMEPHHGKASWLGPVHILNNFESDKALKIFSECLDSIPHSIGFNNHMGSKVTENNQIMASIIKESKNRNIIVVDSVTGTKSVVQKISEENEVKYFKRDVFLDSTKDIGKIKQNLKKTAEIAAEKGYAVAIGHVGAEGGKATYRAIFDMYKEMENSGIEFIGIKELSEKVFGK